MEQSKGASIGARIRELRRQKGLQQQDLASPEVSASYVSLIESGKRSPSDAVLRALAEKLSCSVEYLRSGRADSQAKELRLKVAFADMALRNGDDGEALQAYSEALGHSSQLDAATVRRARLGQAQALEKLGRLEAAITLLDELYSDDETVPGSAEWAQLAVSLCRCYRLAGDLKLAIELGENALAQLNALGLDITDDHLQLGSSLVACYTERGDLTRAQLLANRFLDKAEDTGLRAGRGAVYWNAGLVAESRGHSSEALALIERALVLMAEGDNTRHLAMLKYNCGWIMLLVPGSDTARAKQLIEEAHSALIEVGNNVERASCEIGLAFAELQLGQADAALARADRALGLLGSEPRPQAVRARLAMAEATMLSGDRAGVASLLRTAERQVRHLEDGRSTARLWRAIADLWSRCEEPDKAADAYRTALSMVGLTPLPQVSNSLSTQGR
ncbi:helix-turn-helix domain-containing protein [Streptomyces eurythermus]|jgi:transcriptional regulator with XRE-family HTH domain|uniref:helix-turn-helix domain-containing protein n=1 Tax=Streptomyces eurythermus TaxID=42237 RepID=UPI0037031CF5